MRDARISRSTIAIPCVVGDTYRGERPVSVAGYSRVSRKGMWSLRAISGQNSRRTSEPHACREGIAAYPQGRSKPAFVPRMIDVVESDSGCSSQPLSKN